MTQIDNNLSQPGATFKNLIGFAIILCVSGSAYLFYYLLNTDKRDLDLCDDAIKATLKAPATYKRVEAPQSPSDLYIITYDAANSFGTLLRQKGVCRINKERTGAEWYSLPEAP